MESTTTRTQAQPSEGGDYIGDQTMRRYQNMGQKVVDGAKRALHEGSVRHIVVQRGEDKIAELPLTIGVAAVFLAPTLTALSAVAAIASGADICVYRVKP